MGAVTHKRRSCERAMTDMSRLGEGAVTDTRSLDLGTITFRRRMLVRGAFTDRGMLGERQSLI